MFDALASRWAVFGAVAIGLYVGAEVSIGSIMINFLNQPDVLDMPLEEAGNHLANFYWGGALAGRLLGTLLLVRIRATRLLAACGLAIVGLTFCGVVPCDGAGTGFGCCGVDTSDSVAADAGCC